MGASARELRPAPDVLARAQGETTMLVDLASGECFELNRTGALVWEALARGESRGAIAQALAERYHLDEARAAADVTALLAELEQRKLVRPPPGEP